MWKYFLFRVTPADPCKSSTLGFQSDLFFFYPKLNVSVIHGCLNREVIHIIGTVRMTVLLQSCLILAACPAHTPQERTPHSLISNSASFVLRQIITNSTCGASLDHWLF